MTEFVNIFIQVRMGASRFPGKVLRKFSNGKSTLDLVTENLKRSRYFNGNNLVVLTSDNPLDNQIAEYCSEKGLRLYRGDENNVLKRFTDAAALYESKYVVRVCGDNPFLQVTLMDELLDVVKKEEGFDYYAHRKADGTPSILTHYGFFCEIVKHDGLFKALSTAKEKSEFEHVTGVFYRNPELFKLRFIPVPEIIDKMTIRLTFDTEADMRIIDHLLQKMPGDSYFYEEIINYLEENSDLLAKMRENINKNIK